MEVTENVIRFALGGLLFEYDSEKNRKNIEKHGLLHELIHAAAA